MNAKRVAQGRGAMKDESSNVKKGMGWTMMSHSFGVINGPLPKSPITWIALIVLYTYPIISSPFLPFFFFFCLFVCLPFFLSPLDWYVIINY